MAKGFFERIAALINGKKEKSAEEIELNEQLSKIKGDGANSIAKQAGLTDLIVATIAANYKGMHATLKDKTLTVWIQDGMIYDSVVSGSFRQDLMVKLSDDCGVSFGELRVEKGAPSNDGVTELKAGVWLQIGHIQGAKEIGKAVIRVMEGYGSTIESEYRLQCESGRRYNIGRGKQPMLSGGGIRTNDIAIDDDPSSPQFENNGYVSRAHAYITYYEQFGFLLTVELDGTTAKGHRTDIDRGGQIVRLTNPNAPEVLQYGDCIVLSKKVRLMFEKE